VKKKTTRKTTRKAAPRKGIFPSIDQLTKDVDTAGKLIHVFGAASSSGNFYHDVLKASPIFNSPQACHDLDMLEPVTRDAVRQVIAEAAKLGHKLVPVETYRSQARQAYFFRKHLTRIPRVGCHHFGLACDLAMMTPGRLTRVASITPSCVIWQRHPGLFQASTGARRQSRTASGTGTMSSASRSGISGALFAETWYPASDYRPLERLQPYPDHRDRRPGPHPARKAHGACPH
jgi:hypothetical protein